VVVLPTPPFWLKTARRVTGGILCARCLPARQAGAPEGVC